jgi:regulator of protease activity HflC (stomatin/prohibitin superfamily)
MNMFGLGAGFFWIIALAFVIVIIASAIRILLEYERGVVFRLGRFAGVRGPGLRFIIPIVDQLKKVNLRTVAMDVPPQDIITRDNVSVEVNAVLYFRVMDPEKALIEVDNYLYATSQLAQTSLRSVLGQVELDDLLGQRDKINDNLQEILDRQTDPWGVKISNVEVKHVDLPDSMQRAMARQAESERERRAKVIHAMGEFEASVNLSKAAGQIATQPGALQLRFLQTMTEISAEKNSTILFPMPIDLLKPFLQEAKELEEDPLQAAVKPPVEPMDERPKSGSD